MSSSSSSSAQGGSGTDSLDSKGPEREFFTDRDGNIIATRHLKAPLPWIIKKSAQHRGRYYYYHTKTFETCWALPPQVFQDDKPAPAEEPAAENSTPKLPSIPTSSSTSSTSGASSTNSSLDSSKKLPSVPGSSKSLDSQQQRRTFGEKWAEKAPKKTLLAPRTHSGKSQSLDETSRRPTGLVSQVNQLRSRLQMRAQSVESGLPEAELALADGRAPFFVTGGLGSGGFGVVVEVKHRSSDRTFALKKIPKKTLIRSKDRSRLATELEVMMELPPCPFILRCYSAFETSEDIFFVLDLLHGGNLFFHLAQNIMAAKGRILGLPEDKARPVLAEVVLALEHMHTHGFVHRDVKVENVMLDARGHVKLVDFGLAFELQCDGEQPMSPMGSIIYMPPELIREHVGGRHTDWWAVGILAYEMMVGRSPWNELSNKHKVRKEIETRVVVPPRELSPGARSLISWLLDHDRRRRLGSRSSLDVKRASFFRGVDWDATAQLEVDAVLIPGSQDANTFERDRTEALMRYLDDGESDEVADGAGGGGPPQPWFLGLDLAEEAPDVRLGSSSV